MLRSFLLSGSLLLLASLGLEAQQIGQNTQDAASTTYTLAVKANLVVETVSVKDKQGKPIKGLTAKDFTVTEDGVAQALKFVEHEELPVGAPALPVTPLDREEIKIYKKLTRTQITPETPGITRYKDRRLLTLYFDISAMRPTDQMRALAAAQTFIRKQMTEADLVSIMRYSGGSVDVLQDFSADKNKLLSVIETLVIGEGQGSAEALEDASSADVGAAFGQDDSEFNIFNTDRQLSALQTAASMLGQLNEKKSLIYFASGLNLHGVDNQAQLHATVDAAVKAGVSFWPIDARGLVASAPLGDASQASPGNIDMYNGTAAQAATDDFGQSQDTLFALAGDTGGKAFLDSNDLAQGIAQVQQAVSDYYILGYSTTNTELNGRFRKVKITVSPELSAKLDYRAGYYGGKAFSKFNAVDKERQLEDALMLGDPITELTVAMEIDHFQLNRAEYFVPIIVKIPGRELALAKRGGAEHTLIDFVGEVKDLVGGTTVSNVRDKVNIKLSDATVQQLAKRPVEYDFGFTLLPGRYQIKFLARDDETGRIGTYQTIFTIPNLNKELKRVPISSVVLSSQKVTLSDTLYDVMKKKDAAKEAASDPLVENGSKLIPSVNRVFSTDHEIYLYLQAYSPDPPNAAAASTAPLQPLVAFVSFYKDGVKVHQGRPVAVPPASESRLHMAPFSFTVAAGTLPPGKYECHVAILDAGKSKAAFWQAPILVTP